VPHKWKKKDVALPLLPLLDSLAVYSSVVLFLAHMQHHLDVVPVSPIVCVLECCHDHTSSRKASTPAMGPAYNLSL